MLLGIDSASKSLGFVFSIIKFFSERRRRAEDETLKSYIEWVRRQDHFQTTEGLQQIIDSIDQHNWAADHIFKQVRSHLDQIDRIADNTSLLPEMSDRLTEVLSRLSTTEALTQEQKHRLNVSHRLLDSIAREPRGKGFHGQIMLDPDSLARNGALMLSWRTGDECVRLLLIELLGGLLDNRIAIHQTDDFSITLRVLDDLGVEEVIRSEPFSRNQQLYVAASWNTHEVRLWAQGALVGTRRLANRLRRVGPYLLTGIDVDNEYGATEVRQGYIVDGKAGLNLGRNGVGRGNRLSDVTMFQKKQFTFEVYSKIMEVLKEHASTCKLGVDPAKEHTYWQGPALTFKDQVGGNHLSPSREQELERDVSRSQK